MDCDRGKGDLDRDASRTQLLIKITGASRNNQAGHIFTEGASAGGDIRQTAFKEVSYSGRFRQPQVFRTFRGPAPELPERSCRLFLSV